MYPSITTLAAEYPRFSTVRLPEIAGSLSIWLWRHHNAVQAADGVGDRAHQHRACEAAEDKRVDAQLINGNRCK